MLERHTASAGKDPQQGSMLHSAGSAAGSEAQCANHLAPCLKQALCCREDPTIFSYDLMNEPRSQQDLYLIARVTTDALQQPYNLSYNQGNDLQQWVTNMAGYVKSIDPIHLLTIGAPPQP